MPGDAAASPAMLLLLVAMLIAWPGRSRFRLA
ncbi:hypothetical protein [Stutzerimonas stutzeri]